MTLNVAPRLSILVVDDTPENLRLLVTMLATTEYEVRPVPSGRLALQAAERSPPDLVLLDITMPEMDGYEVCRRLKELAPLRDVPVIFLTALTGTADKLKAFAAGGVDFITKPFQLEEVIARVRAHVALRQAQRALQDNYTRLRELESVRDSLVHMVVHDMRSPLSAILGHLELLKMDVGPALEPESAQGLDTAIFAVKELTGMANDMLDVSRLDEGKLPLNLQPCDLASLARDVIGGWTGAVRGRRLAVDCLSPVEVRCDRAIVRRVLANLVSNGIKHTPSGTAVQITVAAGATSVRVNVRDEGPGVPVEARERIFERFGALAARAENQYHSAGLGLAFCQMAIRAHGGTIGVDTGVPTGSIFWFELPR